MRMEHEPDEVNHLPTYDPGILSDVMNLAQELQNRHQGKLTLSEIEAIGTELGLAPQYVREAVDRVTRKGVRPRLRTPVETRAIPIRLLITIPILWGFCTFLVASQPPTDGAAFLMLVGGPAVLSMLVGYLAGRRKEGILASLGVLLAVAIGVTMGEGAMRGGIGNIPDWLTGAGGYLLCASPIAGLLAWLGAWFRQRRSAPAGLEVTSPRTPELQGSLPPVS